MVRYSTLLHANTYTVQSTKKKSFFLGEMYFLKLAPIETVPAFEHSA